MKPISDQAIVDYVQTHIRSFHERRLQKLKELELDTVLKRKNPYLFRAKNLVTPETLIRSLLDAHLSSQEEGIFGDFLEGLAIFVNAEVYAGRKSASEGIDLEFERDGMYYIVSIKSGPNWGNSQQIRRMQDNFRKAAQRLHTSGSKVQVQAVNGCCYGREPVEHKGDYLKKCGQSFWEFISGDDTLYTRLVEPLGHQAKQRNDEFAEEYSRVVGRFTKTFLERFCSSDGGCILWEELVKFNSSRTPPRRGVRDAFPQQ